MANKKRNKVEIIDKRPDVLKGRELEVVARNLAIVQEQAGYTNEQMAALFDISVSHYERIKAGKNSLSADKLQILYYSLGADLNRLIGDDTKHSFFREDSEEAIEVDYRVAIRDLMVDISHSSNNGSRKQKIMDAYAAFGEMLSTVIDSTKPNP